MKGYGWPDSIVSDRDKLFTSAFWESFCEFVGISQEMSTARHQNSNGLSEVGIRITKDALRRVCNSSQTDWDTCLAQVMFAYNYSIHSATGFSPFYLMHAFTPRLFPAFLRRGSSTLFSAFQQYEKSLVKCHDSIALSHDRQRNEANKRRSVSVSFKVGDLVLLKRDGIKMPVTSGVPNTLIPLYFGPFRILAVDHERDNYTLALPSSMRVHPTFHIRCLKQFSDPAEFFPGRDVVTIPAPVIIEDGFEEFEVDKIVNTRLYRKRQRQFLVRWKGLTHVDDSWEPVSCLSNCKELLLEFLECVACRASGFRSGTWSGITVVVSRLIGRLLFGEGFELSRFLLV